MDQKALQDRILAAVDLLEWGRAFEAELWRLQTELSLLDEAELKATVQGMLREAQRRGMLQWLRLRGLTVPMTAGG